MFSVIQDQQSRELSQGHVAKRAKKLKIEQSELKLPPVVDMAACQVCPFLAYPLLSRSSHMYVMMWGAQK